MERERKEALKELAVIRVKINRMCKLAIYWRLFQAKHEAKDEEKWKMVR